MQSLFAPTPFIGLSPAMRTHGFTIGDHGGLPSFVRADAYPPLPFATPIALSYGNDGIAVALPLFESILPASQWLACATAECGLTLGRQTSVMRLVVARGRRGRDGNERSQRARSVADNPASLCLALYILTGEIIWRPASSGLVGQFTAHWCDCAFAGSIEDEDE